jgi:hypothetical protein
MKVRLTRKYAERIDGIDLVGRKPGDVLDLSPWEAGVIVAEEWAVPERREHQMSSSCGEGQTTSHREDEMRRVQRLRSR